MMIPILALFGWDDLLIHLAIMAVATTVALALTKYPTAAKPAGKDDFELPTAEEGRAYPVVFGRRWINGPNAISPVAELRTVRRRTSAGLFNHKTSGYFYHLTVHWGICHPGLDGIRQIRVAETTIWPTLDDPATLAANGQTTATIAAHDCFGGNDREGGIQGDVHIQYGGSGQSLDSYLATIVGSDKPAYRDITGVIWCGLYIGTVPQLKPWAYLCERTQTLTDGSAMWYISRAGTGNGNLNAVHIIYELLTSNVVGAGIDSAIIGTSFQTAADTCYSEGYGLSVVWDSPPNDVDSLIEQIERLIDGKLYTDPLTGKYEIGIVRADYDPGSLEVFDESDFWVERMATSSPGTVPSKTIVHWHDRDTRQNRPAFAHDIAMLARQGGNPVLQEYDYSAFVCDGDLAVKIAAREQMEMSALPKSFTLRALRTMAHLHETSTIKISYPALNITSMIVRVLTIDRGSMSSGECILEVIEDVFGTAYTTYGSPPAAGESSAAESATDAQVDQGLLEAAATTTSTESGPY